MRTQKTVLILGAGASKGFDLPLGKDLKDVLAKDLNILFDNFGTKLASGSYEIVEALRILVRGEGGRSGDINPHRAAAVQIAQSMGLSGSIDEYIERHKGDTLRAECAKLGISKAILQAERKSKLYFDHMRNRDFLLKNVTDSWLAHLLRDLTRGKTVDDLSSAFENLSIINFNYDRCIEYFVYLWMQQMYHLNEQKAAQITQNLKIFHPYGKLANLPHENPNDHIAFGAEIDAHRLLKMARSIRTYSEIFDESSELEIARANLSQASKLIFLGFGFHQQNIDLIAVPDSDDRVSIHCYATIDGISEPRLDLCRSQVAQAMRVDRINGVFFHTHRGNCEEFWNEFGDIVAQ